MRMRLLSLTVFIYGVTGMSAGGQNSYQGLNKNPRVQRGKNKSDGSVSLKPRAGYSFGFRFFLDIDHRDLRSAAAGCSGFQATDVNIIAGTNPQAGDLKPHIRYDSVI